LLNRPLGKSFILALPETWCRRSARPSIDRQKRITDDLGGCTQGAQDKAEQIETPINRYQ